MAKSILTLGQRRLLRVVLVMAAFLMANAAYLWLSPPDESSLPHFYQWMLVLHVVIGALVLLPMAVFVVWHLKRAFAMKNPRANLSGIVVTLSAFALLFTGLFLFTDANSDDNRWAFLFHQILALAVPLGYVVHREVAKNAPSRSRLVAGIGVTAAALAGMLAVHHLTKPEPRPPVEHFVAMPKEGIDPFRDGIGYGAGGADPASVFFPASTRTQTGGFLTQDFLVNADLPDQEALHADVKEYGFAVDARLGSATCQRCHPDIVEQWARSAHRYSSFNNPFYRASIDRLREEPDGRRRSQWCAGCHDPAVMMAGNMLGDIDPTVAESQAGLTCLLCHAMDSVHGVGGNGNYRIADLFPDPYLFAGEKTGVLSEINELLVRSKPDVHKRDMLKPFMKTPEYCATCHKVSLDVPVNGYRWIRGQDEYDNHQDSGVSRNNARTFYLPEKATQCNDCHMPMVDAPLGDLAATDGKVRSHLFHGPNTALPHIRGDTETVREMEGFLRGKLRVDVFAVRGQDGVTSTAPDLRDVPLVAGERVELQVVVRNQGVGHTFPGGTLDSNESWIHFTLFDPAKPDAPLFESGAVDPETLHVADGAHHYRALFVDEHSREADRRNPQHFRALVHVKVIGPGTADIVRYGFTVPEELSGRRLAAKAVLRWRKFRQNYTEFTWAAAMPGRPLPVLPITDLASSEVSFPVVTAATPPAAVPAAAVARDWVRWNDYGIGLLLQGETKAAETAFAAIRDADPKRVDGWFNLGRTKLTVGSVESAVELLQKAESLAPGDPRLAYFFGMAREKAGQLEEAVHAFERARETFPGDRTIHRTLGNIRYRLGRYEDALQDYLRVLRIDPEDRDAHYNRFLLYSAIGDEAAAAQAERAYLKYKLDESAQKWTQEYRLAHPDVNLESQPIHVHDLDPVSR